MYKQRYSIPRKRKTPIPDNREVQEFLPEADCAGSHEYRLHYKTIDGQKYKGWRCCWCGKMLEINKPKK